MERSESKTKDFTHKQKVFICRVVLLAPVACIISVLLVLLVCMEMLSGQNETVADTCPILNCTVVYTNGSLNASCSASNVNMDSTKMTNFSCLEFNVKCSVGTEDASSFYLDCSWKDCRFCLRNLTKRGWLWQDSLVKKGSRFVGELLKEAKDEPFIQCESAKVKERISACSNNHNEKETPKAKRMKNNTRIADLILTVCLSIGLVAFILMCLYTKKTLKLCCNRLYENDL